jgi:hypothetical protein
MGITVDELVNLHPQLFHMAEEGTWESVRDNGLLSTSALLDRFEINGPERMVIEETNRRKATVITHPNYGSAVIRDQIPMTESALEKCLIKLTPREWYKLLNSRVFFWATKERLDRLFNAEAYRGKTQCIITIDTRRLLTLYSDRVMLSPINSGSTIFKPQPRGKSTFLPMSEFPFEEWTKKRSKRKIIVEVTVDHSVPDISEFVIEVVHLKNRKVIEKIV